MVGRGIVLFFWGFSFGLNVKLCYCTMLPVPTLSAKNKRSLACRKLASKLSDAFVESFALLYTVPRAGTMRMLERQHAIVT